MSRLPFWLSAAQAAYFFLTGVWPIVHIRSFMAVTGPKRDLWLVRTVGALIAVVALAIGLAAWRVRAGGQVPPEVALLAAGAAAALGAVDVIYVARRVIDKVYVLDAAAEAVIVAAWAWAWFGRG